MTESVDFLDLRVGHGEASDRYAVAVDHEMAALAAVRPIVGIGIAEVEGEMKPTVGIHPTGGDIVKPLGGL